MHRLVLLGALGLAACATPAPMPQVPAGGACNHEGLGRFVGQPATQGLGTDLLRASGARTLRWVGHGMMITMDFSPERLTVHLTAGNRVERAICG